MAPTGSVLDQNEEQQQIAHQWAVETASGGQPSAELVLKMNDPQTIRNAQEFRAQKIAALLNYNVITRVIQMQHLLKGWGLTEAAVPDFDFHPMLHKAVSYDDGFGGLAWTYGPDKPYTAGV